MQPATVLYNPYAQHNPYAQPVIYQPHYYYYYNPNALSSTNSFNKRYSLPQTTSVYRVIEPQYYMINNNDNQDELSNSSRLSNLTKGHRHSLQISNSSYSNIYNSELNEENNSETGAFQDEKSRYIVRRSKPITVEGLKHPNEKYKDLIYKPRYLTSKNIEPPTKELVSKIVSIALEIKTFSFFFSPKIYTIIGA
jgi:hypothetical protein